MINYFQRLLKSLKHLFLFLKNSKRNEYIFMPVTSEDQIEDSVLGITEKFKKHPSEVAFSFRHVSIAKITQKTKRLDVKNICQIRTLLLKFSRATVM